MKRMIFILFIPLLLLVTSLFQNCSQESFTHQNKTNQEDLNSENHLLNRASTPIPSADPLFQANKSIQSAIKTNSLCIRNSAPIAESFRIMMGRNPTLDEATFYAEIMLDGIQMAYFEPYVQPYSTQPTPIPDKKCVTWGGKVSTSLIAGIPFNTRTPPTGPTNNHEWMGLHGANLSLIASAAFRTFQCRFPTNKEFSDLVEEQKTSTLSEIIARIKERPRPSISPCFDVLQDIAARILGRSISAEELKACDLKGIQPENKNSICYLAWNLINKADTPSLIVDLIHDTRSITEAIHRNEPNGCFSIYESIDNTALEQIYNPHAIGEYIAQINRVLLGRIPTSDEIEISIHNLQYKGGDTRPYLKALVKGIQNSKEYQTGTNGCISVLPNKRKLSIYMEQNETPYKEFPNQTETSAIEKCKAIQTRGSVVLCKWGNLILLNKQNASCGTIAGQCFNGFFVGQIYKNSSGDTEWKCSGTDGGAAVTCTIPH